MLTGGPGGSGLLSAVSEYKDAKLNRDRDVIFLDQRGTLNADPFLDCREIDAFTQEAVGLLTADAETGKKDVASVRACRDRWAGAGVDLATFDTAENAADLAALRLALKIDGWHVYGVSYRTDLTLFPDSGHGVLDWSTCGPDTVTGFFDDPAKDYRPSCLAGLKAPTFATTPG